MHTSVLEQIALELADHRTTDERDEAGLPMCSCGYRLGWNDTWPDHVARDAIAPILNPRP